MSAKRGRPLGECDEEREWVQEVHRAQRMSGQVHVLPNQDQLLTKSAPLTGIIAEVCTPYVNEQLDLTVIRDYAAALKVDGVTTVCLGSAAGEVAALSTMERKSLISAWAATGSKIVVDVSAAAPDAAELALHAQVQGAVALFVPCSTCDEESIAFAAKVVCNTHIPVYLVAPCYSSDMIQAAKRRIPNLAGVVAPDAAQCLEAGLTAVVSGEANFVAGAAAGATAFSGSFVSAVAPLLVKIVTASQKGDVTELRRLQKLQSPFLELLQKHASVPVRAVAIAKALAGLRLELNLGHVRAPGCRLSVGELQELRTGMAVFVAAYSAAVKVQAKKIDLFKMPYFTGSKDSYIRERVAVLSGAIGRSFDAHFPHLGRADWRRLPDPASVKVARFIDHTALKPATTSKDIAKLCAEAKQHNFFAVCVNGCRAEQALDALSGSPVKTACVIGFPLGAGTVKAKARETHELVGKGVTEIDMVMNVGAMKDKNYALVFDDIKAVVDAASPRAIVKVIFETCLLSEEEIVDASILSVAAGAQYVKTSTGFSTGGATPQAIDIMLSVVGNEAEVKASGGVSNADTAMAYITAGVKRIGTSSGVAIISGLTAAGGY